MSSEIVPRPNSRRTPPITISLCQILKPPMDLPLVLRAGPAAEVREFSITARLGAQPGFKSCSALRGRVF
jgi:hypothetical protein